MRGISTNPEQVVVWIQCFSICSHLSKSLNELYDDAEELENTMKPNRHKEEGMRVLWENSHLLTTETATPYHIINAQVADGKLNVQDALKIRQNMSTLFSSSLPGGFHAPISNKVVTISMTVNEFGCLRNGNKSVIVQRLGILVPNLHPPDVVLDASQLISAIVRHCG